MLRIPVSHQSVTETASFFLGDEAATDGEVEDGLAKLLDVFGAGGEAREVVEVKAGGGGKGFDRLSPNGHRPLLLARSP
jgi:hypothetical protein